MVAVANNAVFCMFESCWENVSSKFSSQKERIFLLWLCVMTNAEKKKNGEYLTDLCDTIKGPDISIMGVPEGEEGEKRTKIYLKK